MLAGPTSSSVPAKTHTLCASAAEDLFADFLLLAGRKFSRFWKTVPVIKNELTNLCEN